MQKPLSEDTKAECCSGDGGCCEGRGGRGRAAVMVVKMIALGLVLLSLASWLGLKARNEWRQFKFIGVPILQHTIAVSGEGKVTAIPDIAEIDLGTSIERANVPAAQKENTRVMNELLAALGQMGVEKKDIQTTNYSIYPRYDYMDGRSILRGYTVTQNVHVKIRDMEKVGDIIGAAGGLGANQVGGISFGVDEPEKLRQEARVKALENAKEKAEALARVAGVTLRRVISFDESGGPQPVPRYYALKAEAADMGVGGAAPSVEAGSTEIAVTATVTYEIE